MKEYTGRDELAANLPYIVMTVLGSAIMAVALGMGAWAWTATGGYFFYGVAGAFWIMYFVCPYCGFWGTRSCPCGYGRIAARLRAKAEARCFAEKFRKHIPVIVPLWFIPPLVAAVALFRSFSLTLLILTAVFVIDAFVILPLTSTRHACAECPQRDDCPWMKRRGSGAEESNGESSS